MDQEVREQVPFMPNTLLPREVVLLTNHCSQRYGSLAWNKISFFCCNFRFYFFVFLLEAYVISSLVENEMEQVLANSSWFCTQLPGLSGDCLQSRLAWYFVTFPICIQTIFL